MDPRQWAPIAVGAPGYVKRSPLIAADVFDELDRHKRALSRQYRRKLSWDQLAAAAVFVVPTGKSLAQAIDRQRAFDTTVSNPAARRRVCALIPYAAADLVEDLAAEIAQSTNRRVRLDDVWSAAFATLTEQLHAG